MFSPSNAPSIETRKALLVLDLQNDFVKPNGNLFVRNVPDFLDDVAALAHSFRQTGDVIWIQTQYEGWRSIVDEESGNEVVFVGAQSSPDEGDGGGSGGGGIDQAAASGAGNNDDDDGSLHNNPDPEAFLTVSGTVAGQTCCWPKTTGVQFPAPILSAIDHDRDTISIKSDYSALQSPDLVLSLRTQFVTEIYLCGSLSNVSVYATALDAVRHGFAVTIVEDCVGFRSFNRHMESMRRMADIMGAVGITTKELIEEHDLEETEKAQTATSPLRHGVKPAGIEVEMDDLAVHIAQSPNSLMQNRVRSYDTRGAESDSDDSRQAKRPTTQLERKVALDTRVLELASAEEADEEEDTGSLLLSIPRTRNPENSGESDIKLQRPRVRRKKVSYKKQDNDNPPDMKAPEASTDPPPAATTSSALSSEAPKRKARKSDAPLGPNDSIGEGDSRVIYDLELSPDAFQQIRGEVNWQKMYHLSGQVPRLVAVQGETQEDNSIPIYRHPADESPPLLPWTPTVDAVRQSVEKILKHPLNHVLIQLYRDGQDRISEHSDKSLDITRGSYICNVSLGAQRAMTLRTKVKTAPKDGTGEPVRKTQKVPLPHNSLFVLGEETNRRWLHSIRPDKRAQSEKSPEELAYKGERISLTFRLIGTFVNPDAGTIWGQGAVSKTMDEAGTVIHGDPTETERMIRAFGKENHDPEFSWDEYYGQGFNVVNFVTKSTAKLFPGGDEIADFRVRFCLVENGIRYDVEHDDSPGSKAYAGHSHEPVYIDPDGVTTTNGDANILAHIGRNATGDVPKPDPNQLRQIEDLLASWRRYRDANFTGNPTHLETWEQALRGKSYLGGQALNAADCALWPILRDIVKRTGPLDESSFPSLSAYHYKVGRRGCVRQVLEEIHETQ